MITDGIAISVLRTGHAFIGHRQTTFVDDDGLCQIVVNHPSNGELAIVPFVEGRLVLADYVRSMGYDHIKFGALLFDGVIPSAPDAGGTLSKAQIDLISLYRGADTIHALRNHSDIVAIMWYKNKIVVKYACGALAISTLC